MTSNKKVKKAEEAIQKAEGNQESDSDSSSDEEMEDAAVNEEIQVEFEGRNPTDGDADGIKQLLKQLFLKAKVDINAITDLILKNSSIHGVGSVLKQAWDENMEDEEDSDDDGEDPVLGITSIINMTNYIREQPITALEEYIIDHCYDCKECDKTDHKLITELFRNPSQNNQKNVGFLFNERFVNIPPAVSVPLLENLQKEIKRTGVEKKVKDFKFHYYVMVLKFHRKAAKEGEPAEDFYSNPEEEFFSKNSQFKFSFSVADECDSGLGGNWKEKDEQLEPFREVVVLDVKRFDNIINQGIKQFLIDGKVFGNILRDEF